MPTTKTKSSNAYNSRFTTDAGITQHFVYECPACAQFHPLNFVGDCRDDRYRLSVPAPEDCIVPLDDDARDAAVELLQRTLPFLVLLGDYIGNGPANAPESRCALLAAIQDLIGPQRLYRAGYEATEGPANG